MDISIEEGTAYIYEDDIERALGHIAKALNILEVQIISNLNN